MSNDKNMLESPENEEGEIGKRPQDKVSADAVQDPSRTISFRGSRPDEITMGKVGPYELVDFLGRGGAGIVYRAKDADGAEVAIKVIVATPFMTNEEIRRFLSEADTSKRLRKHPNIITVYDTGQDGQNYYIAMELIPEGRTIEGVIGKNLPVAEILNYAIPIASALEFAHKEGILHRDLKPANILINEFNQPLLADFGIAKSESAEKLTMTGTVMGTPRYMSPEQCGFGDGQVTNQSDIYSLGLMFYELLTGAFPYPITKEMGLTGIFKTICRQDALPPRKLRKDISRNLEAVILRMLEKEKKLRYKDISQVCADLEACKLGNAVSVRHLTLAEKWEKWVRRNSTLAITVGAALLVGFGMFYGVLLPIIKEKIYAKHDADVSAVAAKRKAEMLQKELDTLKNPGNKGDSEDSTGTDLLLNARNLLDMGKLDEAEKQFRTVRKWAEINCHDGILLESDNNLARIALAKGYNTTAFGLFHDLAINCGRDTVNGRLAFFESGVAKWMQGNKSEANQIWQEIVDRKDSELKRNLDNSDSPAYIVEMAETMLNNKNMAEMESSIPAFPKLFKGLGYWVLAQNATEEAKRNEYLDEAIKNKGIFAWINKKEKK